MSKHPLRLDLALVGAAERRRDHALAAQPLGARAAEHALQPGQRLLDRAVDVVAVVALRRARKHVDLVEALARAQRVLQPALVRDQHRHADALGRVDRRASTSAASASCGITSARTKLVASMRRSPVRMSAFEQADLVGGGDDLGLVLEAVARADLADAHLGRAGGSRRSP